MGYIIRLCAAHVGEHEAIFGEETALICDFAEDHPHHIALQLDRVVHTDPLILCDAGRSRGHDDAARPLAGLLAAFPALRRS
jgi:hypothetical protein